MLRRWNRRKRRAPWSNASEGLSSAGTGPKFVEFSEIDGWRSQKYDMAPPPDREAVMLRVEKEIVKLAGALDEGTAEAMDPLIESWIAQWIATVETGYTDACSVVDVHHGAASQFAEEAERVLDFEQRELHRLERFRDRAQDGLVVEEARDERAR
ncbi:hypothetical protein [Nocardia sp. NPDC057227]|uniref:hypothetical protein n=1 Tax=Nocardia sp. NPDC057227 TaxID=3346056 RepID=UPI00362F5885